MSKYQKQPTALLNKKNSDTTMLDPNQRPNVLKTTREIWLPYFQRGTGVNTFSPENGKKASPEILYYLCPTHI